jgi:hypothetical protein
MRAVDAVAEERERLAGIFRGLADECRDVRATAAGRLLAVAEQRERLWREAVLIVIGEHAGHPWPSPDVGAEPDCLVQSPRDFQYIGIARHPVKAGEKVGVWLNSDGAVWALSRAVDGGR